MRIFKKKYNLNLFDRIVLKCWIVLEKYIQNKKSIALSSQLGSIGSNTVLEDSVTLNRPHNIFIGSNCYIGKNCVLDAYTDIRIEQNCQVAQDCKFITGNHAKIKGRKPSKFDYDLAPIKIGKSVWIGFNVVILPGVEIGDNCIIGAGAVVTKSFENNKIITGIPAQISGFIKD